VFYAFACVQVDYDAVCSCVALRVTNAVKCLLFTIICNSFEIFTYLLCLVINLYSVFIRLILCLF
jgi:hypothetical protein